MYVHDCWFENFTCLSGGTVDPSNSWNAKITHNTFKNCYNGVYMTGDYENFGHIVTDNHFIGCTISVRGQYLYNSLIENNVIDNVTAAGNFEGYGVSLFGSYNDIGGVVIKGNTISSQITNGSYGLPTGIYLSTGDSTGHNYNCTIEGNTVYLPTAGTYGIEILAGSDYSSIIGNTVYAAVPLYLQSSGCSVENNRFTSSSGSSVFMAGTGQHHVFFSGNTLISPNNSSGYNLCFVSGCSGNNITVKDNVFFGYYGVSYRSANWNLTIIDGNIFNAQTVAVYTSTAPDTIYIRYNYFINCSTAASAGFTNLVASGNIGLADAP